VHIQGKDVSEEGRLLKHLNITRTTFIGVGNTLAGDDGVGVVMVRNLQKVIGKNPQFSFMEISGDLYEIWDVLPVTDSMVFFDAVSGATPGLVSVGEILPGAYCPSFHQADLCSVVKSLSMIYDGLFPQWTLWGITIDPPETLGEGLSRPVHLAAEKAVSEIAGFLQGSGLKVGNMLVKF
jgi:hydrogenase maturation protease